MCDEFVIEVLVKPKASQPIPTEEELDELALLLTETVDAYLDRFAVEACGNDEDVEMGWGDD